MLPVYRTLVNGQPISEKTQLHNGARILLGNHHLYRLSCPRQAGDESTETVELMDYEQAMKEISLKGTLSSHLPKLFGD